VGKQVTSKNFARQVNAGGGSRSLRTLEGVKPDEGYAVSVQGHERTFNSVRGRDVTRHLRAIQSHPSAGEPTAMQGGWREDGKSYLDLSHLFTDRRVAAQAMHSNNQTAMHDFGAGRDIHANPPSTGPEALMYGGHHSLGYDKLVR
jgi:hypothetical protein